jgi:hypothetical protein
VAAPRIPSEVDDLTPEWLTTVFRHHAPEVTVTEVSVLAAHSGTTGRVKLALRFAGDRGSLPDSVFLKIAPFDPRQRAFLQRVGIGAMEARFYATLGGSVPVRTPGAWHADADENGAFVIVLEDLDAAGCSYPRPENDDIVARAESTVTELADLHAAYWCSPRFAAANDLSWVPERAGFGSSGGKDPAAATGAGQFIGMALDRFADDMPPIFRRIGQLYRHRAADILDLWDQGQRTLIHGDPHIGNLFTDRERTGFYDWAMFSHSPGMRDIAYYCCQSMPTGVRRAEEDALIGRYLRRLAANGVPFDAALAHDQYRLFAIFAWVSATSTAAMGSRWQPSDRAMAAMHRTTTAVEDLDSVGVLEQLLP